jgi:thymidylate synthase/dihydrofolate reductase
MKLNLIYSESTDNIIGVNNDLFCKIRQDLKNFQRITTTKINGIDNVVIMGYNTWLSIGKILENRINVVITKNNKDKIQENENLMVFQTIEECFERFETLKNFNLFIIGGSMLYSYIVEEYYDQIDTIYQTKINYEIDHNIIKENRVIYNKIFIKEDNFNKLKETNKVNDGLIYNFKGEYVNQPINYTENILQRKENINYEEFQYLNMLERILNNRNVKESRNGIVFSDFGNQMKFDLRNGFPLLTTKKMPWKTILRELIWFINGSTNNKLLQDKNVHIWDGNGSKDFLESRGLSYEEGDLGPIYGFQWRHFGAEYHDCHSDYHNKGIDQLQWIIDEIKQNPSSRRLIMSAWNPIDLDKMALPPCHVMVQFNIDNGYIDAQLYQRSGDMFLGVPFNISSYSFLLHIVGNLTGYIPRYFVHVLGDAHIYQEHIDAINEQLLRIPLKFPQLIIDKLETLNSIKEEYFKIKDYNYYPTIKANMIV